MSKESQSTYITRYIKENLDEVKIRMPKGNKELWQQYVDKRNESLNSYICRIINKAILDDKIKSYPVSKCRKGGKSMNIDFRDNNGKLYSKDILDIALDMEISKLKTGKYVVNLNGKYVFDEEYESKEDAEEQLKSLSRIKNQLENELRNEG